MRKFICMVVCLSVCFFSFNVSLAKGFSESEKKYIEKKKYEVSVIKEDERSLKAKYNEASVNVSSIAQARKKSFREARDIRNRMLKLVIGGFQDKITGFRKEIALLKKTLIKGKSDYVKTFNALVNAKILSLQVKMEKEKIEMKKYQGYAKENNERYKVSAKAVDKVKSSFVKRNTALSREYSSLRDIDRAIRTYDYYLKEALRKYNFEGVKKSFVSILALHDKKNKEINRLTDCRKKLMNELKVSLYRIKIVCV